MHPASPDLPTFIRFVQTQSYACCCIFAICKQHSLMLTPTWVHSCRSGVRPVPRSHRWVRRHFCRWVTSQRSSFSTNWKSCQQVSGKHAALNPVKIREQRHQRTTMKLRSIVSS